MELGHVISVECASRPERFEQSRGKFGFLKEKHPQDSIGSFVNYAECDVPGEKGGTRSDYQNARALCHGIRKEGKYAKYKKKCWAGP